MTESKEKKPINTNFKDGRYDPQRIRDLALREPPEKYTYDSTRMTDLAGRKPKTNNDDNAQADNTK